MNTLELAYTLLIGIGLSAAAGLRVFLPLLLLGLTARLGAIHLGSDFLWLGSDTTLILLAIATIVEIGGYYVPVIDHLLDVIASPAAVIAGIIATAAVLAHVDDPVIKWSLAIIAGGGSAGVVQAGTVLLRGASTTTTAGIGNPLFATVEWLGAAALSLAAVLAPVLVIVVALALIDIFRRWMKKLRKPQW